MRAIYVEYTARRNGHLKRFKPRVSPPRRPPIPVFGRIRSGGRNR
jgi:hypothetical protein